MTGPTPPEVEDTRDLGIREIAAIAPLMVALVFFGFYPKPLMDVTNPMVDDLLQHVGVDDGVPTVVPGDAPDHGDDSEGGH